MSSPLTSPQHYDISSGDVFALSLDYRSSSSQPISEDHGKDAVRDENVFGAVVGMVAPITAHSLCAPVFDLECIGASQVVSREERAHRPSCFDKRRSAPSRDVSNRQE